jgi:cell division protein FtsI (penicillin-binding protein 3)
MSGGSLHYTSSPLLASKTPVWRSQFIVAMLALGFLVLIGRAVYVQVINNDFFQRQGEVRFARTLELPASRGRILDRNGLILASSVVAPSVWAIPDDVDKNPERRSQLAQLLGMSAKDLEAKLANGEKSFVWLRRQLDEPVAKQVAALKMPGIFLRKEYKRAYPEGAAVAHVVGLTNTDNKGLEGAELSFDEQLMGRAGSRRVIRDRLGRVVEEVGNEVAPVDGQDIQLSIDARVQFFAYQKLRDAVLAHKARAGSVVVLDARTGEVLALVNYPSYEPGVRGGMLGAQLRNIALTDTFEPGSIMKPITVAMALDAGKVRTDTIIDTTPGYYQLDRFTIHDIHNYGVLTVEGVIQKSSNIGALKIAQRLTAQQMWETYTALGYGQKPDLRFPGAAMGSVRPWQKWRPVEKATMAYGYGLSASLFQMAQSYTAFAHDGEVIDVSLLKNTSGQAVRGKRIFSEKTTREIRQMLKMAAGPGGTGQRAQTVGYSVGGKSGTARKQEGKGYAANAYRAWFTGMAPIEKPRIIVAVMIDEPANGVIYGGAVAAPVFSQVVQQTLRIMGVAPDTAVKPEIMSNAAEESL